MAKDFDLNEIRKRQRELVEMKKVKQGQVAPPEVDLDAEKIVPKTAKEKRQNFWYHYKWATLATVAIVGLLTWFVVDMATKEKYDLTIMAFNHYQGVLDVKAQETTFSYYADDTDKNGKVSVLINSNQTVTPSSSGGNPNIQLMQVSSSKLFAGMQMFEGFIFLLDEATYDRIVTDTQTGETYDIFYDLSEYTSQNEAFQGDKLYLKDTEWIKTWGFDAIGIEADELPNDLFLCLRDYTKFDNPKADIMKRYEQEKAVFDKLVQAVIDGKTALPAETASQTATPTESR